MKNFRILGLILLAFSFSFTSCDDDDDDAATPAAATPAVATGSTIAELATNDGRFDSLVVALSHANLVATFQNPGSYTVFAPNNQAFANYISSTMGVSKITDIDSDALADVLKYHVLGTQVLAGALTDDTYGTTLNTEGANNEATVLEIDITGGAKINNNANIVDTDIRANNGVIHEIDKIITKKNIVELALNDERFSILVAALQVFGDTLLGPLSSPGDYTVFAPTDAAFNQLLLDNNWTGLGDIPRSALNNILRYHVLAGTNAQAGDLSPNQELTMFNGGKLTVDLSAGPKLITTDNMQGPVNIIVTDVQGTNGVIHAVQNVLLP